MGKCRGETVKPVASVTLVATFCAADAGQRPALLPINWPTRSQYIMPRPAVFLDRDGTLNRQVIRDGKPFSPMRVEDFALFDDVPAACADLAAAGFVLVVATNQPDVGRGAMAQATVEAMHENSGNWFRRLPGSKSVTPPVRRNQGRPTGAASPSPAC